MHHDKIAEPVLLQFEQLVKSYKTYTFLFLGALFIESVLLIFFFPFLVKSAFFAITLAALLITLFSFYTLRNYQAAEKEEALRELAAKYIKGILSTASGAKTPKEVKQMGAEACLNLAEKVSERKPKVLSPLLEKLKFFLGDEEVMQFQEILYRKAIEEFSGQVRLAPCDITAHARLARAFILLAQLKKPLAKEWLKRAIEEYKILSELSPQETWILVELSNAQHELGETAAEIETLEKLTRLDPHNSDNLYKLGRLYFHVGQTSKGFKVFENLKSIDLVKSDQLIAYYR